MWQTDGQTDRRTDRQTDRRTENTICRAAWSQLKIGSIHGKTSNSYIYYSIITMMFDKYVSNVCDIFRAATKHNLSQMQRDGSTCKEYVTVKCIYVKYNLAIEKYSWLNHAYIHWHHRQRLAINIVLCDPALVYIITFCVIDIPYFPNNFDGFHEISYPFPNFMGCTVEIRKFISKFIPHFITEVTSYPTWDSSLRKRDRSSLW